MPTKKRTNLVYSDIQILMELSLNHTKDLVIETLLRRKSIDWLIENEFIKLISGSLHIKAKVEPLEFKLTDKGQVLVDDLLAVKLPVKKWVSSN